jgi:hypothetical protein
MQMLQVSEPLEPPLGTVAGWREKLVPHKIVQVWTSKRAALDSSGIVYDCHCFDESDVAQAIRDISLLPVCAACSDRVLSCLH